MIVAQFENIYGLYKDFQTRMERYWSLRWIAQDNVKQIEGIVVKGDLVRFDGIPFTQRVPGLPELPRGKKVVLDILGLDYIGLVLEVRLKEVRDEVQELGDEEPEEEAPEAVPEEAAASAAEAGAPEAPAENPESAAEPAAESASGIRRRSGTVMKRSVPLFSCLC